MESNREVIMRLLAAGMMGIGMLFMMIGMIIIASSLR